MNPDLSNCRAKDDLQHRVWDLVSRFHILTSHLFNLVGTDRQEFAFAKADCAIARAEIHECRRQLQAHRKQHGC